MLVTGPRMDYLTARALYSHGLLSNLYTPIHVPDCLATVLERIPSSPISESTRRLFRYKAQAIPDELVQGWAYLFLLNQTRRRVLERNLSSHWIDRAHVRAFKRFASSCDNAYVWGYQSSSLEFFAGRQRKVLEVFSPPLAIERIIQRELRDQSPGWESHQGRELSLAWSERMEAECELADRIIVPAERLIKQLAGRHTDPAKFVAIPFPFPELPPHFVCQREIPQSRPIRVMYAGTLSLIKGIAILYRALRRLPKTTFDVHLYGSSTLTPSAMRSLGEVATLHGPVSFPTLLEAFSKADVFVMPSYSEGCALVNLQAAATGLPVFATPESGAPHRSFTLTAGDPTSIVEALEVLQQRKEMIPTMSRESLLATLSWTEGNYIRAIGSIATDTLSSGCK